MTDKILSLRFWDDPILSKVCDKIDDNEFGAELGEFGRQMIATMKAQNGLGLAAVQVGEAKRMFTMSLEDKNSLPLIICNPLLQLGSETALASEGCLSMPNVFLQIKRAVNVVLQYKDPLGIPHEIALVTPMNARVAQHEADHLDGIFFINRVSRQMRRQALREWEKVKEKLKL